ncbi:rhodanese-like domain-containing protein [Pelosinus sp. UFO1]|uniref:rhodanese-like domain-containing protein n=1 Tax=Pelosinus sp. UFO1 TaxID=484770 RepID=UPI0004D1BEA6|nr:rhodanese-like domain-containing protein [Pelosinus sp. UFO1]AIF52413.1 Rhodanese-like protein [Pelosinus sp. UFO1]
MLKIISPEELKLLLESDEIYALIDVRERNEYEQGQILGATQVPRRLLESRIPVLIPVRNTKVILYDNDNYRSSLAAHTLKKYGYTNIYILAGGLNSWKIAGYPVVEGIHVLSKSFGEIVGEIRKSVPKLSATELKKIIDSNEDSFVIIEVRPLEEVQKTGSIPGAISIPGVELPLRITDYAKNGQKIITTCAGRTRGFISCATLKLMGIDNVYDLNNGTMGWQLAGFDLEKEVKKGALPSFESKKEGANFATKLANENNIQLISVKQLQALQQNAHQETLYLLDVRSHEEYAEIGHIAGSIAIPGGQAIQNTDDVIAVHNATIVFVCDNSARAIITAYWYNQMGFTNVYVLDGGLSAWTHSGHRLEKGPAEPFALGFIEASERVDKINPDLLKGIVDKPSKTIIIDVEDSKKFHHGHIPGAHWVPRGWLEKRIENVITDKGTPLVVTCSDGFNSVLAAVTLLEMDFYNVCILDGGTNSWVEAGFGLTTGMEGIEPDDWHVHLTEFGSKEAIKYLKWEEDIINLPEYMNYFYRRGIVK